MATQTLTLELPEELVALLGSPEAATARAKEALVLELLRQGTISQGKAAHLLGIDRWAILDLIAEHQIPSGPANADEMRRELADMAAFANATENEKADAALSRDSDRAR